MIVLLAMTGSAMFPRATSAAQTVIHQTASGRSAFADDYGFDACTDWYVFVTASSSHDVSSGGGNPVTNSSVLNGYSGGDNFCTGTSWYVEFDGVVLTPSQFRIDTALNQAALSGNIAASFGWALDSSGNFIDLTGAPVSLALQWQNSGTVSPPPHNPTHFRGTYSLNSNASGATYSASISGSVSTGANIAAITPSDGPYATLSENLTVSTLAKRFQPIVIPAGTSVTLANATFAACDPLTYGYQLNSGPLVVVGSRGDFCGTQRVPNVTIGPFAQRTILRIFLTDNSASYCPGYPAAFTYFSDGFHALVGSGNPLQVDIMDSGVGCSTPVDQLRLPSAPGQGNLSLQVVFGS